MSFFRKKIFTLRAAMLALRVHCWIKTHDFEWIYSRLEDSRRHSAQAKGITGLTVDDIVSTVHYVYRWSLHRVNCLEDSLVIHHILCCAGIPNRFFVGVQRHPFRSHAWVEHKGTILNGNEYECRPLYVVIRRGKDADEEEKRQLHVSAKYE